MNVLDQQKASHEANVNLIGLMSALNDLDINSVDDLIDAIQECYDENDNDIQAVLDMINDARN